MYDTFYSRISTKKNLYLSFYIYIEYNIIYIFLSGITCTIVHVFSWKMKSFCYLGRRWSITCYLPHLHKYILCLTEKKKIWSTQLVETKDLQLTVCCFICKAQNLRRSDSERHKKGIFNLFNESKWRGKILTDIF